MREVAVAAEMLRAYSELKPEQQLEVLIRVWSKEDPSERGMGKSLLLAILMFEACGVPVSFILPEKLVEAVSIFREMSDDLQQKHGPGRN